MENNDKKKKITLAIIGVLVLLVGIVGLTYAYFMARGQSEDITVTSKNLKLVFDDSTPVINATDIEPIEESEILTKATKKTFRISKESSAGKDLYVRLDMTDLNLSDNFKDFDLKWALYKGEEKITTGTFVPTLDGSTSINMATNILINSTTPIEYNLYIWINETGLDQSNLMDGRLTGKITAVGEAKQLNTLASNILKETAKNETIGVTAKEKIEQNKSVNLSSNNNAIASSYTFDSNTGFFKLTGGTFIDVEYDSAFIGYYTCEYPESDGSCYNLYKIKEVTDNSVTIADEHISERVNKNRGLFVQKDDNEKSEFGFPTYYYRGSTTNDTVNPDYTMNNYVKFGTYKSDGSYIYARVGRENKTFNYTSNSPILWRIIRINEDGSIKLVTENVTGTYTSWNPLNDILYISKDGTNSNIKNTVDNWYKDNITEKNLTSKIQQYTFCNDEVTGRIQNNDPIFKCRNGARIVNEKAGMITADEVVFSGVLSDYKIDNNITYLNNGSSFWTITTADKQMYAWSWNLDESIIGFGPAWNNTIIKGVPRTVINLKADTIINGGIGTETDPYIIN